MNHVNSKKHLFLKNYVCRNCIIIAYIYELCLILKKTTVQLMNVKNMKKRKANASAKSKEVQPHPLAIMQLHHICFCPNTLQLL